MAGKIHFHYNAAKDVVIARPAYKFTTEAEIDDWLSEFEAFFAPFGRKMDVILDLTEFSVDATIGPKFGAARAEVEKKWFNRSYRVKPNLSTSLFMHTSAVIHGATDNSFPTVEAAIEALEADRESPPPPQWVWPWEKS